MKEIFSGIILINKNGRNIPLHVWLKMGVGLSDSKGGVSKDQIFRPLLYQTRFSHAYSKK